MSALRGCAIAWCAFLLASRPAVGTTYHVAPDSSGDVANIQAAIDAAASGDEIILSDGTFTGDGNWDLNFGTKDLVLRSVNGYEATIIDCGFHGQEVVHSGVTLEGGQTGATVIDGLTIQAILSHGDARAIRCVGASPVIQRVRIRESLAVDDVHGLGIFVESGSPIIVDCVFGPTTWRTGGDGAAIYGEESWLTVRSCSFTSCYGFPVVRLDGGTIEDCTFDGTRASEDDLGLCIRVAGGRASIVRCRFRHSFGGGIAIDAGEVLVGTCAFENNTTDYAAGVYGSGTITIRNTTFRANLAAYGTSVVGCQGAIVLDHCVFAGNQANWDSSGEVSLGSGSLAVTHCSFVGNLGGEGGASIRVASGSELAIDHSIIALGGGGFSSPHTAVRCDGSPLALAVACTDIFGNDGGDWTGCVAGMETTNGNLSADPLFCGTTTGDFSLQANSPCAPPNSGGCGLIGALGVACGATALQDRSWGSIKALYR
ncbi:MAG: right-handed parallel beta-helix repeat-containing protein [bacterium]